MTIEEVESKILEIESQMSSPEFWSDSANSKKIMSEYSMLQKTLTRLQSGNTSIAYPGYPAIVTIMSGAGGDDSEDFTRMLYDMYQAYCRAHDYTVMIVRSTPNSMNGFRSLTFKVYGEDAFDRLRFESGVHRLIRISPFNAKGKRQTSFCMVEVVPEILSDADVELRKDDLEIQFARSGGPGGQNVNKRETAVRITHVPSGVSVHVDGERTQEANREEAMSLIRGKLAVLEMARVTSELGVHQISKTVENEWGSQIRTYTLNPYRLVKDHRSGAESTNVDGVLLSGDIDQFTNPLRL